jgi:outer membrane murein-binding lipoprotein Lpp
MKKTKRLIFLFAAILLLAISACGVSKDEHERVLIELEQANAKLEQAESKIAAIERTMELPQIDTEIMEKLRSAQQKAGDLSSKIKTLTTENEQLKEELAKIKAIK